MTRSTSDRLLLAGSALMIAGSVVLLTVAWRRRVAAPPDADLPVAVDTSWRSIKQGGHRRGPAVSSVTITEFADFQCPFCAKLEHTLKEVVAQDPSVSINYLHFPLPSVHPYAVKAAIASECARQQGRFDQYRELLFEQQSEIGHTGWAEFAQRAGVKDEAAFAACVADSAGTVRTVIVDAKAGRALDVRGTPDVFVNDFRVHGAPSAKQLALLIQRARAASANSR